VQEELNFSELVTSENVGNEGTFTQLTPTLKSATAVGANEKPLEKKINEFLNPELTRLTETSLVRMEADLTEQVEVKGYSDHFSKGFADGHLQSGTLPHPIPQFLPNTGEGNGPTERCAGQPSPVAGTAR
jgi:hypothetical protein